MGVDRPPRTDLLLFDSPVNRPREPFTPMEKKNDEINISLYKSVFRILPIGPPQLSPNLHFLCLPSSPPSRSRLYVH